MLAPNSITPIPFPNAPGVEYGLVAGFPAYCVGTDGSIWTRYTRKGALGEPYIGSTWKRMRGKPHSRGYTGIRLHNRPFPSRAFLLHRLVLETFVGPCPDGALCCHNDGDPSNNALSNLRWDTPRANQADRIRHGTAYRGSKVATAILTEDKVRLIREALRDGRLSKRQIAKQFGVSYHTVRLIGMGKSWAWLE